MKNYFNGLIIKLDTTERRSKGFEDCEKLLKLKHKEKRMRKNNNIMLKKYGILSNSVKRHNCNTIRRGKSITRHKKYRKQ